MQNIQQPDPKERQNAIWFVCMVALLGVCVILIFNSFQDDLQSWLEGNINFLLENRYMVFVVSLIAELPIFVAGIYLYSLGTRSVRAQRFPPPGAKVTRKTPVLEGAAGIRRGRLIQLISLLVLCCAAAIPVVLWFIFSSVVSAT